MHFFQACSAAIAVALPLTQALPSSEVPKLSKTNRITLEPNGPLPIGPIAHKHALEKHGVKVPDDVHKAADRLNAAGIAAHIPVQGLPFDQAYVGNVTVGGQKFRMEFNTGSGDLWLYSKKLPASQRGNHMLYDLGGQPNPYFQGKKLKNWGFKTITGEGAKGNVYADKVVVGPITQTTQHVLAATSISPLFQKLLSDGNFGLGRYKSNSCTPPCDPFIDHDLYNQLQQNLFTSTLRHATGGEFDFGFIDSSKYTGKISYKELSFYGLTGHWDFYINAIKVGNNALVDHQMDQTQPTAIADSGTALLLVPDSVIEQFYGNVDGAYYDSNYGGVLFPCANAKQLPPLNIYMNVYDDNKITMPGSPYGVYGGVSQPAGYCYGGVQSSGDELLYVLGNVLLKSQFVVYDQGAVRIGFAQQKGAPGF